MKVKGEGKVKQPVSHRDRDDMRWEERDSPAEPETRANRSPEEEVSRLRDFPRRNTEDRASSPSLVSKDSCPPALPVASSPTSCLRLRLLPPRPHRDSLWLPIAPSEKALNSFAQHSKHVSTCPQHSLCP